MGANAALASLEAALQANDAARILNAHSTLLNRLGALETMLQKAQGDPGDILQMVRRQRQLYIRNHFLPNAKDEAHLLEETDKFIRAFGKKKNGEEQHRNLLQSVLPSFKETAKPRASQELSLSCILTEIAASMKSAPALEKAHRGFLVKLSALAK